MKKIFTLIAVAAMALTANAQQIFFGEGDVAATGTQNGKVYSNGSFSLTVVDQAAKMAVDAKRTWFGAAAEEGIDIPAPVTFKTEKKIQEFKKRLHRLSATITKQRKSGENDGKEEKDSI